MPQVLPSQFARHVRGCGGRAHAPETHLPQARGSARRSHDTTVSRSARRQPSLLLPEWECDRLDGQLSHPEQTMPVWSVIWAPVLRPDALSVCPQCSALPWSCLSGSLSLNPRRRKGFAQKA